MTYEFGRPNERTTAVEGASPAIARAAFDAYSSGNGRDMFHMRNVDLEDGFAITDGGDGPDAKTQSDKGLSRPERVGAERAERMNTTMTKYWDRINTEGDTVEKGELKRFLEGPDSANLTPEERADLSLALENFHRIENADRGGGFGPGMDARGISKKDLPAFTASERRYDQSYADIDYMRQNFDAIKGDDDKVTREELKAYRERRAAEGAPQSELDTIDRWSAGKAHFKQGYIDRRESTLNLIYLLQGWKNPYRF